MGQIVKRVFGFFQKAFIVFAVYIAIISIFAHIINKDKPHITTNVIEKNRKEIYSFVNDPKFKKDQLGKLTVSLYRMNACFVLGEACTNNPLDADKNYSKSLIGQATGLMMFPIANPPASGITWTTTMLANAGVIPKIYAAEGIGFGSLRPIMKIWTTMRNVSFLVLVLVIVTIGFMVMFRTKINPQTIISVENSLPKIVMALIYITFSFAIAGFLIDLMYFLIAILISLIGTTDPSINVAVMQKTYLSAGPGQIFNILLRNKGGVGGNWFAVGNILWSLPNAILGVVPALGNIFRVIGAFLGIILLFPFAYNFPLFKALQEPDIQIGASLGATANLTGLWKLLFSGGLSAVILFACVIVGPTILIPVILGLVILLTVLMLFFRILLLIFSSYIKLLMFIALAPLYLMLEAFPGQSTFTGWLRNILSELSIYPVLIAVSLIAILIADGAEAGTIFQPPFLTSIDPKSYANIISMWFLFVTPELVGIVQKALNPKPLPLDAGIGTFFGGATSGLSAGMGEMSKYAILAGSFKPLGAIMGMIPGFKKPGEK